MFLNLCFTTIVVATYDDTVVKLTCHDGGCCWTFNNSCDVICSDTSKYYRHSAQLKSADFCTPNELPQTI